MIKDAVVCLSDESVAIANLRMIIKGIGGLPVVEDGKLLGILTHRDVVLAGEDAQSLRVCEIMKVDLVTVEENTKLKEIASIMKKTGYQRLPVVEGEYFKGIVTQSCVINAVIDML